jgi:hypothetical protein
MFAKSFATAGACAAALMMASAAHAVTIVHVSPVPTTTNPFFYLTNGTTPTDPVISATFGAGFTGPSVAFDDIFEFTIPQNGTGSGSVSTSFSSLTNELTFSHIIINGTDYIGDLVTGTHGSGLFVGGIPITNGVENDIEIVGQTSASDVATGYSGTATFNAAPVPEPASWALMISGLFLVGAMLRRPRDTVSLGLSS